MQIKTDPEGFADRARSLERQQKFAAWSAVAVASAISVAALHNIYAAGQPWIRLGQAWMLTVMCYMFAKECPQRFLRGSDEPCARFLERQHQEQAKRYLRLRGIAPLLIPGIVASWLGGGPSIIAQARGLDPSSWLFRFCAGPWPFVIVGVALVVVWWAFGAAARKANGDLDALRRRIADK